MSQQAPSVHNRYMMPRTCRLFTAFDSTREIEESF